MAVRLGGSREYDVPEDLEQWLDKWEPRISGLRRKRRATVSVRASVALDELEFLLARTVENQVTE
ncbi:MAG: hypothetical protein ACYCQJ_07940 [Nitrososphaerales archaeon]